MNHPSVYSYQQIVNAAFQLLRTDGWNAVTARAIAREIGSSTMPIYSRVESINDLEKELRERARQQLRCYQKGCYTEDPLLNAAFGYILFARDERFLFRFLYLDRPENLQQGVTSVMPENFVAEFGDESAAAKALAGLDGASQEILVRYTWIFTHGLAMLVNAGALDANSDEEILQLLTDAGEAFYLWGRHQ